jgi:hypothetical protein
MSQKQAFVGMGLGVWHQRVGSRVRFVADINGRTEVHVGEVAWASPTAALIKVRVETENEQGKPVKKLTEFPTDLLRDVRTLRKGEST